MAIILFSIENRKKPRQCDSLLLIQMFSSCDQTEQVNTRMVLEVQVIENGYYHN